MYTGKDLIALGYTPGKWFQGALSALNTAASGLTLSEADVRALIDGYVPPPHIPLRQVGEMPFFTNIDPGDTDAERANVEAVSRHMVELMRVPTVRAGAVMPDACPSDPRLGYIPVGGVVATENAIHPGMHSADICCSMAISVFDSSDAADATRLLDAGMAHSHFGGGGRARGEQWKPPSHVMERFENNILLKALMSDAIEHFGTQGDGNHFYFVGRLGSTGKLALVTHHGSRAPGAKLYKLGMRIADRTRQQLSPETPDYNAWIIADSYEGEAYWDALQAVRAWTKASHFAIHDRVASVCGLKVDERFWNEHNFVFRKSDGLFYHAKGATPAFDDYAYDASGLTLVPLNMAEPVLILSGADAAHGLGFAPHGAGRNYGRKAHIRSLGDRPVADIVAEETSGLDIRFFSGHADPSELPSAYKNAASVRAQIESYQLGRVVDTVEPIGSIMAGDWQKDAPWKKKRLDAASREFDSDENGSPEPDA